MMRQPLLFVLVGGLQYLVDAGLFALLMLAGVPTAPGNLLSRACAAGLGFMLNRTVTFERRGSPWGVVGASFARFIVLFLVLTALSTLALLLLEQAWGQGVQAKVAYKLGTEAVLAVLSFFVSRHWVYRR